MQMKKTKKKWGYEYLSIANNLSFHLRTPHTLAYKRSNRFLYNWHAALWICSILARSPKYQLIRWAISLDRIIAILHSRCSYNLSGVFLKDLQAIFSNNYPNSLELLVLVPYRSQPNFHTHTNPIQFKCNEFYQQQPQ